MAIKIIQEEIKELICDWCDEKYEFEAVNISFGYGSNLDMDSKNFCSDECCYDWVINELCPINEEEVLKK